MKKVEAIIRHERLQQVQDVLDDCGVSGVTVTEVMGCGAQRGYTEHYRGTAVNISLRPRLKIEAVMRHADYLVDIGPGAGRHGGRLLASGTVAEVLRSPDSVTAAYLRI